MRSLAALLVSLIGSGNVHAATINAPSCSNADITTAISSASDGDTVAVPSGNCSWTGSVTIPNTKGVVLQGAGAGATHIALGTNTLYLATSSVRQPIRITGFRWIKNNAVPAIQIMGTAQNWRIDHNHFQGTDHSNYTIRVGDASGNTDNFTYGLIDHNTFSEFPTAIFIEFDRGLTDAIAEGDWVWSQTAQRGTAQAVYIEDNTFSGTSGGNSEQVIDCRWGCKYVMRYNQINNPWISTHSGCTNGGRDPMWQEIYNNTFSQNNPYPGNEIEMRSTSGVFFGNTSASMIQFVMSVDHERSYRTDCAGPYGAQADGTRAWDENSVVGWRAMGQPGWGPPQTSNMTNPSFAGVFAWGNRNNGATVDISVANNDGNTPAHVVSRREYFNEAHISSGVLASRPSTCSAGPANRDVYRATDENTFGVTLYICSATNTWTKHYEPYTYPHPLQGGGGGPDTTPPAAPTNLLVSGAQE